MDLPRLLGLLARTLASGDAGLSLAGRLCGACVEILEVQGGTLTVASAPDERLAFTTPALFSRIEALQEVLGEGPAQQALQDDRIVVARLDDGPSRFPVLAAEVAAKAEAPLTVHAVPMHAGLRTVGVLSLYVTTGEMSRSAGDLQLVADAVGTSVTADLDALDWSRQAHVHQATGMVAAQLRVPPEDALVVLRAHAFARSAELRDVAAAVLDRRMDFADGDSIEEA